MNSKVRVAVIGCGRLGSRHAEKYRDIPQVELVGVCDHHLVHAQTLAAQVHTKAFGSLDELYGSIDAASICTPAQTHYEVAKSLITHGNGVHLLVEKPITTNLREADEILALGRKKNLTIQIGHVERFNAAVRRVTKNIIHNPQFIECDRIGPYDSRISDVGVVLDLMIHDIDMILHIVQSRIKHIDAVGLKLMSPTEDFANARITFENGTVCSLTASRMARDRLRKIRVFQKNAYISVDYKQQEAQILTKKNGKTDYQTIVIKKTEPLREEIKAFVDCIRGKERPNVSGEEGRNALEVALQIIKKIQRQEEVLAAQ